MAGPDNKDDHSVSPVMRQRLPLGSIEATAPAKVNLFLHIVGKRPDGYHLLESLFAFTTMGDKLKVSPSNEFTFSLSGPFAAALSDVDRDRNLVVRAAKLFAQMAHKPLDFTIELEKNLPIASGIGGGSSDAAQTLKLLHSYWGLDWPLTDLEELALRLGADVPACLYSQPLMVRGIGEVVEKVPYKGSQYILLVNPGQAIATPQVFKAYGDRTAAFDPPLDKAGLKGAFSDLKGVSNSLQAGAVKLCPEIKNVLGTLKATADVRTVRMSGSGATCFALYDNKEACREAANIIKGDQSAWWVCPTELQGT